MSGGFPPPCSSRNKWLGCSEPGRPEGRARGRLGASRARLFLWWVFVVAFTAAATDMHIYIHIYTYNTTKAQKRTFRKPCVVLSAPSTRASSASAGPCAGSEVTASAWSFGRWDLGLG